MDPETLFSAANVVAMAGWAALLAAPLAPRFAGLVAGVFIPLLLSAAYAGLILAFFAGAEGGFGSLAGVQALFRSPEAALAGWLHFLAFDLFVGAWVARTALTEGVFWPIVMPCLLLAFLFGPAGFLAFQALRAARGSAPLAP